MKARCFLGWNATRLLKLDRKICGIITTILLFDAHREVRTASVRVKWVVEQIENF